MRSTIQTRCFLFSLVLAAGIAVALPAAAAAANEKVVLKGGKSLELSKPYVIKGSQAIMTLKDGTVISVPLADVDKEATAAARAKASAAPPAAPGATVALTPVEAARAQQEAPKARVKLKDDDVSHAGYEEPSGEAPQGGGEGSLQVVDWNQTVNGETVTIKGTLRNTGKARAENVSMSISAKDDAGKIIATSGADIAAGSLEPGASAGFVANLNATVRVAGVRFAPQWSSPPPPKKEKETAEAAKKAAVPAPAKPAAEASPKKPEYTPSPNYAAPTPSAPTTAPTDSHTGYIPGAHEEAPPPPPSR